MEEAHLCERNFDWEGAEHYYLQAAQNCQEAALQSNTYDTLSALFSLVGRESDALKAANQATEAGLESGIEAVTVMAIVSEGFLNLKAGKYEIVENLIEQALEKIAYDADDYVPFGRVRVLLLRSRYAIEKEDLTQGEDDLSVVWPLIEPWQQVAFAGGCQSCLAKWWESTAELCQRRSDLTGLITARREAVVRTRKVARLDCIEGPYKFNALAFAWWRLAQALTQAGDPLAKRAFNESRSIRQSIGLAPFANAR